MGIAVIRFPGTNNEYDVIRALSLIHGTEPYLVNSNESPSALKDATGVVIPGGFSYGDYLRAGAVASIEEILDGVRTIIDDGKPVLGICNGFQILTEAKLLPGTLLPNESARFICKWVYLKVSESPTPYTEGLEGMVLRLPIAHAEGNYHCSESELRALIDSNRIPFKYCDVDGNIMPSANPNGSQENIAGVLNEKGNVMGMMPHPERASRAILGSEDGLAILENFARLTQEA